MSRYEGKPFLRLLERYILHSIGELSSKEAESLRAFEPNLRQIYSLDGSWSDIVAAVMEFPPSFPQTIRDMWIKNSEIARQAGTSLGAFDFAVMFIDTNFPFVNDRPPN